MKLVQARELFVASKVGVRSPATVQWYRQYTSSLVKFLGEELIAGVSITDLRRWRASLTQRKNRYNDHPYRERKEGGISRVTLDNHIRASMTFFRWLVREGYLDTNPSSRLERPELGEEPPKAISLRHVNRLLQAAKQTSQPERDYAIVRILAATGIRRGGLTTLQISDVDLEKRRLYVCEKGNKSRFVPFDEATSSAINAYLEIRPETDEAALFLTNKETPLTGNAAYKMLRRLAQHAGVDRYNPHAFRHFAAMQLIRNGADPKFVQLVMGHSSLKTTMIYVRWVEKELMKRYDEFAPLGD